MKTNNILFHQRTAGSGVWKTSKNRRFFSLLFSFLGIDFRIEVIYHKRLFENAEDRRVTGCIYPVDNRNALRFPQVPTLSFRLFSESRWVNPIPSNPTQQASVKCRLPLYMGLFNRKQNCAGMIERERERERERVLISWENVQRLSEENYLELIKTCVCFCNCGCCIEWVGGGTSGSNLILSWHPIPNCCCSSWWVSARCKEGEFFLGWSFFFLFFGVAVMEIKSLAVKPHCWCTHCFVFLFWVVGDHHGLFFLVYY